MKPVKVESRFDHNGRRYRNININPLGFSQEELKKSSLEFRNTSLKNVIKQKEQQLCHIVTDLKSVAQNRILTDPEKMLSMKQQLVEEKNKN